MAPHADLDAGERRAHLTQVLQQWSSGEGKVADFALPVVYNELRHIAGRLMRRERSGHTLQATAVVNEVYLQLSEQTGVRFANRAHFVGRVVHMMRRVLVAHARSRNAQRRGGDQRRVTLAEAEHRGQKPADLVALDDALLSLAAKDPEMARLVELRYFGGLTLEETAEVLGVSRATVVLQWRRTRVWLHRELAARG
ncbi:MAG: ECF-type sigma factor [Acidobacteriota bacterium]